MLDHFFWQEYAHIKKYDEKPSMEEPEYWIKLNYFLRHEKKDHVIKGQLISECILGVFNFPKETMKKIDKFLRKNLKVVKS